MASLKAVIFCIMFRLSAQNCRLQIFDIFLCQSATHIEKKIYDRSSYTIREPGPRLVGLYLHRRCLPILQYTSLYTSWHHLNLWHLPPDSKIRLARFSRSTQCPFSPQTSPPPPLQFAVPKANNKDAFAHWRKTECSAPPRCPKWRGSSSRVTRWPRFPKIEAAPASKSWGLWAYPFRRRRERWRARSRRWRKLWRDWNRQKTWPPWP